MLPAGSERMKMLSIIHRSIVWPPWASFPSSTSFISFLVGGDISLMPYPKGTAVKSMLSRFCTICTAFQLSKEISRMLNLSPSRSMIFRYSRNSPHFLPWSLERHDAPTDYIEHGCAVHGGQMFLTVSRNRVRHNIYPHHPEMGILVQKSWCPWWRIDSDRLSRWALSDYPRKPGRRGRLSPCCIKRAFLWDHVGIPRICFNSDSKSAWTTIHSTAQSLPLSS